MAGNTNNTVLFERRTFKVLAALIVSMSAVSGLLILLEPRPLAPGGGPALAVLDTTPATLDTLFTTQPAIRPRQWQAIVVHHSGTPSGNLQTLSERHRSTGLTGIGYHFVIGNGDGAADGEVQVGYRWTRQLAANHLLTGQSAGWYDQHAVAICLVGDGNSASPTKAQLDQLVKLVNTLQRKLAIPADRVMLMSNLVNTSRSPGMLFPAAQFRQQLLDVADVPGN